jgi:hypothetical protein
MARALFLVPLATTHVATPVTHFIYFEMGYLIDGLRRLRLISQVWRRDLIAVVGMKVVVYVALEIVRTMKPSPSANTDSARKPLRAVVSVWTTTLVVRACGVFSGCFW